MIETLAGATRVAFELPELIDPAGPEFYVLIAMIVFLAVLARVGAFKMAIGRLDERAARIRRELEQAAALKAEAEALMQSFAQAQKDAEGQAARILAEAKQEAERIRVEGARALEADIARRTAQAEQRILQAQAQATREVRAQAASLAVETARAVLAEKSGELAGLTDQAIEAFPAAWRR